MILLARLGQLAQAVKVWRYPGPERRLMIFVYGLILELRVFERRTQALLRQRHGLIQNSFLVHI